MEPLAWSRCHQSIKVFAYQWHNIQTQDQENTAWQTCGQCDRHVSCEYHKAVQSTFNKLMINQPPYLPKTAIVGGVPTPSVDIPITAVFLALYLTSAACNFGLFHYNRAHGHKFLVSLFLGGFSMARLGTCVLRIAWATRHHNARLTIAAEIFTNAGVLIVYLVNLELAKRVLRAQKPKIGWHPLVHWSILTMSAGIGVCLVLIILAVVWSFYTLNMHILETMAWIQKGVIIYIVVIAISPWFLLAASVLPPRSPTNQNFGKGNTSAKLLIVAASTGLTTIIAGFKIGTAYSTQHLATDPAWYDSRAAFYCFNFMLEVFILCLFVGTRIDQRFYVPDGSSKRRSYEIHERKESLSDRNESQGEDSEKDKEAV
jgi:hypothetical protein